jgi:hypothetical protein
MGQACILALLPREAASTSFSYAFGIAGNLPNFAASTFTG